MFSATHILGLGLLIIAILTMLFFTTRRGRANSVLRAIPAFQKLRRAIGLSVEEGKRLHVSIGNGSILGPNNASALIGLSALERAAQISIISDRPPIATGGDGALAILSQDTLRAAYRSNNALEQYDPGRGRLAGVTPFSYTAGTIPLIAGEQVSANLLIGYYGPEVALLCESAEREGAFTMAASHSLPAQAVMYATADEPLIGEELFAIPAYLQAAPMHQASLRTQDVLRWVLALLLTIVALSKLAQSILGVPPL